VEDFRREFIAFALDRNAIRFGEFKTKAGRLSPYFFNAGLFSDGASLRRLGQFYAQAIVASTLSFDMLFGPAYKGITLAAATAIALSEHGHNVPFAFNRKEAKDHGEGGSVIGAPLSGKVLIIDDVISAGTSVRESVELIHANGAEPAGVAIALDRMERSTAVALSAVQEVEQNLGIPAISIVTLDDLVEYISSAPALAPHLEKITDYRGRYGCAVAKRVSAAR
jgi:orotate phosphoribosyltransferase